MSDPVKQYLNILSELVPYDYKEVITGSSGLFIKYKCADGKADPLNIWMNSTHLFGSSHTGLNYKLNFSPINRYIFTKRIKKTPFFVNYLRADDFDIYVLDFNCREPAPVIYRLFFFRNIYMNHVLRMCLPEGFSSQSKMISGSDRYYFNYRISAKSELQSGELAIQAGANQDILMIQAFSTNAESVNDLEISHVFSLLNNNIDETKENHIEHNISAQNPEIMKTLDTLWSRIKVLSPGKKPPAVMNLSGEYQEQIRFATAEIGKFFGWPYVTGKSKTIENPKGDFSENLLDRIWNLYNNESMENNLIVGKLQSWWDRYSLPIYDFRFNSILEESPEKLFVAFVLAQWFRLPWGKKLLIRCNHFKSVPELEFLAFLNQLVQIRTSGKETITVKKGSLHGGNFIKFHRGKIAIHFSRFGKREFSGLTHDDMCICKMDKAITIQYDADTRCVHVLPDIGINEYRISKENILRLKANKYKINANLLWKKAELQHGDLRLRWILKKRRFQFTFRKKGEVIDLEVNDKKIKLLPSDRIKLYQSIRIIDPNAGFSIYDGEGRSFVMNKNYPQDFMLVGWLQNQYGLLVNKINFKAGEGTSMLLSGPESGRFSHGLTLHGFSGHASVQIKKHIAQIETPVLSDPRQLKILNFSAVASGGHLLTILEPAMLKKKDSVRLLFIKEFGFSPELISFKEFSSIKRGNPALLIESGAAQVRDGKRAKEMNHLTFPIKYLNKSEDIFAEILKI
jgi:hypothetical protein